MSGFFAKYRERSVTPEILVTPDGKSYVKKPIRQVSSLPSSPNWGRIFTVQPRPATSQCVQVNNYFLGTSRPSSRSNTDSRISTQSQKSRSLLRLPVPSELPVLPKKARTLDRPRPLPEIIAEGGCPSRHPSHWYSD